MFFERSTLNRIPWAPLNVGVFLIVLALVLMIGYLQLAGLTLFNAVPLVFAVFGLWLMIASFVFPPTDSYAPPRIMVLGWGAVILALGMLWFVWILAIGLLPIIFGVLVLLLGIGFVGYSFMKAENKKPSNPIAPSP